MTTVFVAGVHGVGKTTCCTAAAAKLSFHHITASQIIKDAKGSAISSHSKLVAHLDENQKLLIAGMATVRRSSRAILLDGHMTLQTAAGITPIPLDVFRALRIDGLIVVLDAPHDIQRRLAQRDGRLADIDAIKAHQSHELSHAEEVARVLDIALERVNGPESAVLAEAICRVIKRG